MGFMMLTMVIVILGTVVAIGMVGSAFMRRQMPPSSAPPRDDTLIAQAERIELLEEELRRVKDQADFTEKLLTERGNQPPGDELGKDSSGP